LRRALGETPDAPRFIATIARRGYRFIGTLATPEAHGCAGEIPPGSRTAVPDRSINRRWLGKVATAAVFAGALVVAARRFQPVTTLQGASNPEAYRLYERGRYFWAHGYDNPTSLESSRDSFLRAIALDPQFARAHAGLAMTYGSMAIRHLESPDKAFAAAKTEAARALQIDERTAEAHYALGSTAFRFEWDWNTAERELRRAIDIDPAFGEAHQLYGDFLTDMGRYEEALRETGRAVELEPQWGIFLRSHGRSLAAAGRLDEAIAEYERALTHDPNSYRLYLRLSELHEQGRGYEEAITLRARAAVLASGHSEPGDLAGNPDDEIPLVNDFEQRGYEAAMHDLYIRKLDELDDEERRGHYVSPFTRALLYARLGDRARAIVALERAADRRSPELVSWNTYPELAPLASDPRIRALLANIKIPVQYSAGSSLLR
jgi:tetratricopeptide (TPR) repeat protein